MKIDLASNEEGQRISELLAGAYGGGNLPNDVWSEIYPHWLVARRDDSIVGCINLAISKPIGRLNLLAVDRSLRPHARGRVVWALILRGLATLKHAGCTASVSQIPFELQAYKRALKKHFAAIVVGQGNTAMRVL